MLEPAARLESKKISKTNACLTSTPSTTSCLLMNVTFSH